MADNPADIINQFNRERLRQQQENRVQINWFRAGASGLAAAGLAKFLFGNRGR